MIRSGGHLICHMFTDFDLDQPDFKILVSPISSPLARLDDVSSLDPSAFDSTFTLDLGEHELDTYSQPLDDMQDIPVPQFAIQVTAPVKKTEKKASPTVFKPFSSFESLELTVKGLRDHLGKDVTRSHSMPIPDLPHSGLIRAFSCA